MRNPMYAAARLLLLAAFAVMPFTPSFSEDAVTLVPGDPAPAFVSDKWFNGDPVTSFEQGKIYVVECWATWCGPCKQSIPHLSEMNTKFKDKGVVFIGADVLEQDDSGVEPFVKSMGEKMNYRVALDKPSGPDGNTAKNWLKAAGQGGIPCAFVVDKKGILAWVGHPMMGLDEALEKMIAGNFNIKKEAEYAAKKKDINTRLRTAWVGKNFDDVLKILNEMETLDAKSEIQAKLMRFNVLLTQKKDEAGAYKAARTFPAGAFEGEDMICNSMAWAILDTADLKNRDLTLAITLARRADAAAEHKNPNILDTLARAYFDRGEKANAVKTQKEAIALAPDDRKEAFKKKLEEYMSK